MSYVATIPLVCSNEYEMLQTLDLVSLPLSSDSVKPNIYVDMGIPGKEIKKPLLRLDTMYRG